jgi:flagellar motility protein MotE (MotC chaperone)
MPQARIQTRLCPHCANSIALDALTCPYCKGNLIQSTGPEFPHRSEDVERPNRAIVKDRQTVELENLAVEKDNLTVKSKFILALGLLVFALGVYLVGGNRERSDLSPVLAEQAKAVQEKDEKIKNLEAQLDQLRKDRQGTSSQIEELKRKFEETQKDLISTRRKFEESQKDLISTRGKFEESQKDLASTRRKLFDANREVDRLASSRVTSVPRPAARTAEPLPPQPSAAPSRRTAEPGTYETLRQTTVYEEPTNSARPVAQIGKGTEVTVVRSVGDWVEVRSKHGKPPGYIRSDEVRLLSRAN